MAEKTAGEITRQIVELLRHRHPSPEWATFVELRDGTGARGRRFIDFFALNLWPSKKFWRVAYEVKATRSDFLRELKDPSKRAPAERLANECYFVMPYGIVEPDEVPTGWGLIELWGGKGGLRRKKQAQQREVDDPPLAFVASLARQAALPDPDLPAVMWMLAGQEIGEEELLEAAGESIKAIRMEERRKALAELRDRDEFVDLRELRSVLDRRLGRAVASSPERLNAWLDDHIGDEPQVLDWRLRENLKRVRREIDALLEKNQERIVP